MFRYFWIVPILALSACIPSQDPSKAIVRSAQGVEEVPIQDIFSSSKPELGSERILKDIVDYAALSAAAYSDPPEKIVAGCPWLASTYERWTPVDTSEFDLETDKPEWRYRIGRAKFKIWAPEDDQPGPVVISFRGTDFKQATDWFSNLRWITRIIPGSWDQYDQVRSWMTGNKAFLSLVQERAPGREIVAVGHSLGGGLAQQAVYATTDISKAVTFNASSVTGYYSVDPEEQRLANAKGSEVYRVYEHGEVLAYLRWFMKQLYNPFTGDMDIVEVRYDVLGEGNGDGVLGQHSMATLACKLAELRA